MAAPILKNRAGMTTTTTGTGTVTLGSALTAASVINQASWQTFAAAGVANAQVVRYLILDSNGAWEYGTGTYTTSGTTLTRTLGGSSTGSLLNLSASSQVFIAAVEEDIVTYDGATDTVTATLGTITGTTASSNYLSGALIVSGGLGVAGAINGQGDISGNILTATSFRSQYYQDVSGSGAYIQFPGIGSTTTLVNRGGGSVSAFKVQGDPAQTSFLQIWTNSSGVNQASVGADGSIISNGYVAGLPVTYLTQTFAIVMPPITGAVVPEYYEIAAGITLEIGLSAIMEITG